MSERDEIRQNLQKQLNESVGEISAEFMNVSARLEKAGLGGEDRKQFERLFKTWMRWNQTLNGQVKDLLENHAKAAKQFDTLREEKRRLEVLYASGIQFATATEMKTLMGKAIDVVVKELQADAGFIVLCNAQQEIEAIVARNMDPDDHPEAKELSTGVIRETLSASQPTHISDMDKLSAASHNTSIIRLGIKSVLCVPLVSRNQVLGAVYLDRRDQANPFRESDLLFLLSFARQIVQGLEISREIALLENKLLREAQMKISDLRREFACDEIIGSSRRLFEVLLLASKVSPTNVSVIILGENGSGKELLARAIHHNSRRTGKPMVAINCSAIPADLLESELFGYEAGAFTGATKAKPGKLEMADGGTLFLDEIAELNPNLQAKLLRVLQTGELERLGSVTPQKIDLRIIAATNQNIVQMVRNGKFREDLYYRLKVVEITLPPLRERKEDLGELAAFFLKKHDPDNRQRDISEAALEVLEHYHWPGNVRELENVILRAIVLARANTIEPGDLPPELVQSGENVPQIPPGKTLEEAEQAFRKRYILRTLKNSDSKADAARALGVNRTHFYRMLAQLGIEE
ncbi:MAG: sigma 54-interacting transcriptional regulator [Calditrichaeota bacterium]|nr:sigma 54-interacting transcriptional regulator [Calditrichota bacterium]